MKVGQLFNVSRNKITNQYSYHLKIKEARKMGLTPYQISQMNLTKSRKNRK